MLPAGAHISDFIATHTVSCTHLIGVFMMHLLEAIVTQMAFQI